MFHAPIIAAEPWMRVAAVVTSSAERADRANREYPPGTRAVDGHGLFTDPSGIDLAVIATPNRGHALLAMQAIAAGLPVVVDKPFTVTVVEAEQVIAAAHQAGTPLSVFQNRRWDSDF